MTNYNFNSIKFNLEYGLGGKPVSRGLFQFYQFSLIPCQATKITWQELFLCALLILIIKRHHHIRQLLLRFFQNHRGAVLFQIAGVCHLFIYLDQSADNSHRVTSQTLRPLLSRQ